MNEEIKLYTSNADRERWETLADMYAIFVTLDHLEKAFIRDSITPQEYTPACTKLISQFKAGCQSLGESINWDDFMQEYQLSCPAAKRRLLVIGVPATTEHSTIEDSSKSIQHVADATQRFITLMDLLKLNMIAIDQIHPLLSELIIAINKVGPNFKEFNGKSEIKNWLILTNSMKASDTLSEDQIRQLIFDLERAHNSFYANLSK